MDKNRIREEIINDVDIACYTPDEFSNWRNKSVLIKEALENGIEV